MILALTETDGLAMALLATMLLSFGVIALLLFSMLRSSKRRDKGVDNLLEEMDKSEQMSKTPAGLPRGEPREEWERDQDWWKSKDKNS